MDNFGHVTRVMFAGGDIPRAYASSGFNFQVQELQQEVVFGCGESLCRRPLLSLASFCVAPAKGRVPVPAQNDTPATECDRMAFKSV